MAGGGSLLIAWQLKDKKVCIVGGGKVAAQRLETVLETDAHITVISTNDGLDPHTKQLILQHGDRITHQSRLFSGSEDLDGMDIVLTALDDVDVSRNICQICRAKKIPVNAADIPDSCDFYFGSQIRQGPLQVMVSTNGCGPKMANLVKMRLKGVLSGFEGPAIEKVGKLRAQLKIRVPEVGGPWGNQRMKWMVKVCETWTMKELASLDDSLIQQLLDEGWEKNAVPTLHDLTGYQKPRSLSHPSPLSLTLWLATLLVGTLVTFAAIRRR